MTDPLTDLAFEGWSGPAGVTAPQRYVFHCHILEHEDNSMMRPLQILP